MITDEQRRSNIEALTRGVDDAIARDLGCAPTDDMAGLLVDRLLAEDGLMPLEALDEMTPERRAIVLNGKGEAEASANVATVFGEKSSRSEP